MALLDNASMVDAKRFETIAHATVLSSGRLRFATDAMEMMELEKMKSIILFALPRPRFDDEGNIEFAAVCCVEDDPRGFSIKTSGPYRYISLKNFFIQQKINFKDYVTTFEVTEVNEKFEESNPVYRLTLCQTARPHEVERLKKAEQEAQEQASDMPF